MVMPRVTLNETKLNSFIINKLKIIHYEKD